MDRYALVIGVSEYSGNGFKKLTKPVKDAEAVAQVLEAYGDFGVTRLPSRVKEDEESYEVAAKNLPGATLQKRIKKFLTEDAANKNALIYFSGHGFTAENENGDRVGYLASSDCSVELDEDGQVIEERNGIPLGRLNKFITDSKVSSLVLILDCCNSGYFLESFSVRRNLTEFKFERDYYLITACGSSKKAYEGREYSILTGALLRGLRAENAGRKGRITGDRLFDFISEELAHSRQEPLRMGWGQSIVIVRHDLSTLANASILVPINNDDPKGLEKGLADDAVAFQFNPENPYLGLQAFESEQATYFGGREKAVRALLDHLTENRFLAIIGASGSGKSSLVKAGLLPELQGDRIPGSRDWRVEFFRVGQQADPAHALAEMLAQNHEQQADPAHALAEMLAQNHEQQLFSASEDWVKGEWDTEMPAQNHEQQLFLLFIDQFEELFTLCPDEIERQQVIEAIAQAATDPNSPARIILAIRGDFLDRLAQYPAAAALLNRSTQPSTYIVSPLTLPELEEAIEKPAAQHGVTFEPGLVAQIASDVQGQAGALPQLQYALRELWQECIQGEGRQLTLECYEEIGGVEGALQKRAEALYATFSPSEQGFIQRLMLDMVESAETEQPTRRPIAWKRVQEISGSVQSQEVVKTLTTERLLVADERGLQVAHEALFSKWSRCAEWIAENRDNISRHRRLERDAQDWFDHAKGKDYLLPLGKLVEFETWQDQLELLEWEAEFVWESRKECDRLQQEEEARQQREIDGLNKLVKAEKGRRNWAIAGAGLAIVAFAASFLGFTQAQWAKQVILASFFGVSQPEQVQQILSEGVKAIDDGLKEASQLKGKNDETALQYYRQIREKIYARLDEVRGLQKDAKTEEETAQLQEFQKVLEGKLPKAENGLIELIEQHRIQTQLKTELEQNKIKEALQTTRKILMEDTGADRNSDGLVGSQEQELKLIPCATLKSIEELWRDSKKCAWLGAKGDFVDPNCTALGGSSLIVDVFDQFDWQRVGIYISEECKLSSNSRGK